MRKSLVGLAVLATTSAAFAQSSVTFFGVLDATLSRGSASGTGSASKTSMGSGGYSTPRIGLRGTEDLGGGMWAGFWLEGQVFNQDGSAGRETATGNQSNTTTKGAGLNFSRRSTVSLGGTWGEVRLGRDYVPNDWNWGGFDPFGNVGLGTALVLTGATSGLNAGAAYTFQPAGQGTNGIMVRASNMVSYILPEKLGGFYGQASYWFGNNAQTGAANQDDGTGGGGRIGYQSGPLNVAAAWQKTKYRATPVATTAGAPSGDLSQWSLGADWKFANNIHVMGEYGRDKRASAVAATGTGYEFGTTVPFGPHEIRAAFSSYKIDAGTGTTPEAKQFALGYAYYLSKRTIVYTTIARVHNTNGARMALDGAVIGAGLTSSTSTGFDVGLRHAF